MCIRDSNNTFYISFARHSSKRIPLYWRPFAWLSAFKDKRFGHAQIFWETPNGDVAAIGALPWAIRIASFDRSLEDYLNDLKTAGATACIKYTSDFSKVKPIPCGFFTCVSVIKSILGIKSFFVITPKQLFRTLNQKGKFLW